jgi:hypothetical protein
VTSAQDGGIAMTMKGAITVGGESVPLGGGGVVDPQGKKGRFSITTAIGGKSVKLDEIMAGKVIYVGGDMFGGKLPDGKHWLKVDLRQAAAQQGIDLDALGNQSTQDPSAALEYLEGAGRSRKVGAETINGTQTTRYHVDVDLRKVAAKSDDPNAKSSVEKLIKTVGRSTIPIDVWVDGKHLVRREKLDYDMNIQGQTASFDMTIDLTRFNQRVEAQPPSDGDTIDFQDIVNKTGSTTSG